MDRAAERRALENRARSPTLRRCPGRSSGVKPSSGSWPRPSTAASCVRPGRRGEDAAGREAAALGGAAGGLGRRDALGRLVRSARSRRCSAAELPEGVELLAARATPSPGAKLLRASTTATCSTASAALVHQLVAAGEVAALGHGAPRRAGAGRAARAGGRTTCAPCWSWASSTRGEVGDLLAGASAARSTAAARGAVERPGATRCSCASSCAMAPSAAAGRRGRRVALARPGRGEPSPGRAAGRAHRRPRRGRARGARGVAVAGRWSWRCSASSLSWRRGAGERRTEGRGGSRTRRTRCTARRCGRARPLAPGGDPGAQLADTLEACGRRGGAATSAGGQLAARVGAPAADELLVRASRARAGRAGDAALAERLARAAGAGFPARLALGRALAAAGRGRRPKPSSPICARATAPSGRPSPSPGAQPLLGARPRGRADAVLRDADVPDADTRDELRRSACGWRPGRRPRPACATPRRCCAIRRPRSGEGRRVRGRGGGAVHVRAGRARGGDGR